MNSANKEITPSIRAKAAAWVTALHGPRRNARLEAGLKQWLNENPAHARAFEQATDAMESIGTIPRDALTSMIDWDRMRAARRMRFRAYLAIPAAVLCIVVGLKIYFQDASFTTGVGEQRSVILEDGTRVFLNTNSRISTHYSTQQRKIELEKGEALFEVAKREDWPFIVVTQGRQIIAVGTKFLVRRENRQLSVTLVEGKVAVSAAEPAQARSVSRAPKVEMLSPGERLIIGEGRKSRRDAPSIEQLTAWINGQIILDETPLADAIVEMNRYSSAPLSLDVPNADELRVSGVFRVGDSMGFARAIAATYGLDVINVRSEISLTGIAHVPDR